MDMAALSGRSLLRLGLGVGGDVDDEVADGGLMMTGLDFCASFSVMLTAVLACDGMSRETSYWPVRCGGRVSFTSGTTPAIDVSGTPEFLGGTGGGSRV